MIVTATMPLVFYVYMFLCLCQCCPPCALPDSVSQQVDICNTYLSIIICLFLLTYYVILTVGNALTSKVRFIQYNVNLNLLSKYERNSVTCNFIEFTYIPFVVLISLEESASVVYFVLDVSLFDAKLYHSILSVIKITALFSHSGVQASTYIVYHHKTIFQPVFCNFELAAFWIFSLLLTLSSDVHPNPGPLQTDQIFHSGFLSFCNWNLNTLSKDEFY